MAPQPTRSRIRKVAAKAKPAPRKLTAQQERFAQHVVMGYSATAAYLIAYPIIKARKPSTTMNDAYKLRNHREVSARIDELTALAATAAVVSRGIMISEMGFNRTVALDGGKVGVAATSSRDRARVSGLLERERAPSVPPDDAAALVKDQVDAVTANLFELGRRVYFTLEQGKRRAALPAPKPKE